MADPYRDVREELCGAGIYVPRTEDMGSWSRIVLCSEGPPEAKRFGGRSFWFACVDNGWYVGTWGSHVYRFPNSDRLLPFASAFLTATGSMADFPPELIREYGLGPLPYDEATRVLPDERSKE